MVRAKSSAVNKAAQERLEGLRIDQRYRTGRTFIRCAAFVAGAWFLAGAISDLAGRDTNVFVNLFLSVFADFKLVISVALTGCAIAWAMVERRLRHRKVEYLQERVRSLETDIDPQRSTSTLTTRGQTNPRDRD